MRVWWCMGRGSSGRREAARSGAGRRGVSGATTWCSGSARAIVSHIQSQSVQSGRHSAATTHLCSASARWKKCASASSVSTHATPERQAGTCVLMIERSTDMPW